MTVQPLPPVPTQDLEHVIEFTPALWDSLRGQRIFLTGGTGFVGTWLLEAVAHANDRLGIGCRVAVLTRSPEGFIRRSPHLASRPDVELLQGDVRNFEFPLGEFGFVIHGATTSAAISGAAARRGLAATIIDGTARTLEAAARAGAANVLFLSSGAVYGPQPANLERLPENYPGTPDPLTLESTYAEAKRMAEHLCVLANSERTGVRIARLFAFIGPLLPLDAHFAAGNFIRDAANGRAIVVKGDGTPLRSYLHAADLVVWLLTILLHGKPAWPYNVGSDDVVSIAELASLIARSAGIAGQVKVGAAASQGPGARYVPEIDRARNELGLDVRLDLEQSIVRTLRWVRTNR